ncbi:MAG TPA: GAF domain-containing protein, partial [Nitrospiria bacterium]
MRPASQVIQSGRIKPGSGKPDSHSSFPDPHLLKSGRLDLVFKNLPLALGISLLTGFLSVALFWEAAPRQGLLIWFSSLGLISLYRYQMLRAYRKLEGLEKNLDFWEARYTLGAALAGIAWGGLAFLLFRGEPIVFQVFASFILGGMVIGSVVINGPLIRAFLAFTIPTVLPILVRFFLVGETVYSLMGVMTLVFSGTMIGAAFQFRAVFERSMKLGFDNTRMARHLLEEKGRSDYLSKELTSQAWKDRQTQDAVNFVSEKTSGETGKDFLNSLVKHLATVFRVRYAFLMEMNPEDPDRGNVLSFWNGSAFEKPFACPIKGSPLGEVLGGGVIHYPNGVGPMVRGVPGFDGLDLEGFLGFPLVSSEGKVIGQIGLLHHRNLSKNETRLSVLKVFSLRAVSELNRKHFEDDLKLFRTLVDRANDA